MIESLKNMADRVTSEFRWAVWRHADTGVRLYRVVLLQRPTPTQPKGWVLDREVPHNKNWTREEMKKALDVV
jgi:hypothetical protein